MNCLPVSTLHWHRLHVCLGVCLPALVYFVYAWTILGSTGLLRLLDPTASSLLSRSDGMKNGCSNLVEGSCLVDSGVARFVRDHISYAQDIIDLWFDCGLPLSVHVDSMLIQTTGVRIDISEALFLKENSKYAAKYRLLETGNVTEEFAQRIGDIHIYVGGVAGLVVYAFTWPQFPLPVALLYSIFQLRSAQIQDAIVKDPSAFLLSRQRAALMKEDVLSSVARTVANASVETFAHDLIKWTSNATTPVQAAIDSGSRSLRLIEHDIALMHDVISSIPFYRLWRIYYYIFGGDSPMTLLGPILDDLLLAEKTVSHALHLYEDLLENLLLMDRYLRWYTEYSSGILASYRRDDLRALGHEVNDVVEAFEQLTTDCRELLYLADQHPRDLVGSPVLNRRKNQMAIEG